MEENNISTSNSNSNSSKKHKKRKTHKRKPQEDKFINVSETRREIFHYLQLHRSSTAAPPPPQPRSSSNWDPLNRHQHDLQPLMYHQSIIERLPLPGPIWSTTEPSLLAPPPPPPPPPVETLELFENQSSSSSYDWWFEFLNTLDCKKKKVTDEVSKCPGFGEINRKSCNGNGLFGQSQLNVADHDDDDQISVSPDEWLTFPLNED